VPVYLPPLRERRDDVALLARHFLEIFSRELNKQVHTFAPHVHRGLADYAWPGNIRELKNVIERAVLLHDAEKGTTLDHLPLETAFGGLHDATLGAFGAGSQAFVAGPLAEAERRHILATLQWTTGNKTRAAKILGISRQTLREKLKSYGIAEEESPVDPSGQIPIGR
jgi:DNA-binding NtrC family response regulator